MNQFDLTEKECFEGLQRQGLLSKEGEEQLQKLREKEEEDAIGRAEAELDNYLESQE